MSSARCLIPFVVVAASALSCSSKSSDTATSSSDITIQTGEFDIPAGDSFECFYTDTFTATDHVMGITGSTGHQQPGGHHITVYYTDLTQPKQHHACSDSEMVQWHMVAGADVGGNGGVFGMPAGFAYKLPAGKQIVLQVHYINTTGKPRTVNDDVTLHLVEGSQVKTWANQWLFSDEQWSLPAKQTQTSATDCTINSDLNAFLLTGHMHELGKHYKLERIDDSGNVAELIYDTDWQPSYASHPPVKQWSPDAPYVIKKGTKLRQTCQWQNDTDAEVIFPREMCVFFGFYYPDQGEVDCQKAASK